MSAATVEWLVDKYAKSTTSRCPALATKRITSHVLRHIAAMFLREACVDISDIGLWVGNESIASSQNYIHTDLAVRQRALDKTTFLATTLNRYHLSDSLLAYLDAL